MNREDALLRVRDEAWYARAGGSDPDVDIDIDMVGLVGGRLCNAFRIIAMYAESSGCGNCGEQAAIAFFFLFRQRVQHISLLGYMQIPDDHAMVVVGMDANRDLSNTSTWGSDAWICDPWLDRVFHRSHIPLNIRPSHPPIEICCYH